MTRSERDDAAEPLQEAQLEQQVALLIDGLWQALRCGEQIDPKSWAERHPDGVQGLPDVHKLFHVLSALDDTSSMLREDSQPLADTQARPCGSGATRNRSDVSSTVDVLPGSTFRRYGVGDRLGKYAIKEVLGSGGQATTYKVWDPDLERHAVVKFYHVAATPEQRKAVVEEGQKLVRVRSPNLARCYAVERDQNVPYLVLEYIVGRPLNEVHRSRPLSFSQSLAVIAAVAEGLHAMHTCGLLHCDVKPSNILLGDDDIPRLIDLGLSKPLGDDGLACRSGTPPYMAPEQARGDSDQVGPWTDVFGLGATLYFLLTGVAPHQGATVAEVYRAACLSEIVPPRERNAKVPSDVNRLCLRCLAKTPEGRFESARELYRSIRGRRRRRSVVLGAASLAVMVVVVMLAYRYFHHPTAALRRADVALKIEAVEFQQLVLNERNEHERRGLLLQDPYLLRLGDGLQFRARLSHPAYCVWLAFRPDGVQELCFPQDPKQPPPLTDEPIYPVANYDTTVYGLTDAVGLQVFVLVASETPLPCYDDWRKELGVSPWRPTGVMRAAIRHHDGHWEEAFELHGKGQTRGAGEPLQGQESPLADLVAWLQGAGEQRPLVDAWALPVLPRDGDR